jgi:hypothetical protein
MFSFLLVFPGKAKADRGLLAQRFKTFYNSPRRGFPANQYLPGSHRRDKGP